MKNLKPFSNYPSIPNNVFFLENINSIFNDNRNFISYGNGRSYGDACLYSNILYMRNKNHFLSFDETNNILEIESGVLLDEILNFAIPKGLFLKHTPGTKLITIGGAIAFDVHGKNHHIDGSFSESVKEITLLIPKYSQNHTINYEIKKITPDDFLFKATCGGAGLTGIILSAKIQLIKIKSKNVNKTAIKTTSIDELLETFEHFKDRAYCVAWLDLFSDLNAIFEYGDFSDDLDFILEDKKPLKVPINFPNFTLNKISVKTFNFMHFNAQKEKIKTEKVDFNKFFYPLDSIIDWNKIYGTNGFSQYQFMINDINALKKILKLLRESNAASFLSVLKKYAPENKNLLSFPFEGYSLALDFKISYENFRLMDELDSIVIKSGGRVYLAKDCRLQKSSFLQMYKHASEFINFRKDMKLNHFINSNLSRRLGL